jgi:hypothetical protein
MQPEDIRECVDMVANHPVIGPRYGPDIGILPEAWLRLLDCEPHFAAIFYADEGLRAPICFLGVTAAVHDDFINEIKALPQFWVGPELARRIVRGESPLLTNNQFRDANSGEGLNMFGWEGFARPGYEAHSELHHYIMAQFIRIHQGYLWKEIIANQAESADRLSFFLRTGAALWDPTAGCYTSELKSDPGEFVSRPHILGTTRDLERRGSGDWAGSWVGTLFDYQPPVLGFNQGEQRLLSSALLGMTDDHLAGFLETSLPAVKKMWISIYRRVEEFLPGLIPDPFEPGIAASGRGKEKRRGLLAYLREHPEELRPVSRKLVSKARAAMRAAGR